MPIEKVADGVWSSQSAVRFYGIPMSSRTTIARLGDGELFVCSPGALDDDLRRAVDELGEVRALVAPNRFHHLFVNDWRAAYPDASVHVPGSLKKKRPDLADAESLGDEAPAVYAEHVEQLRMRGLPALHETWFYHRESRTLIDTDLMHNMRAEPRAFPRIAWKSIGAYGKLGPSMLERFFTRDAPALRESLEAALEWPFERIVVAHGDVCQPSDPRAEVRASWGWLFR